MILPCSQNDEWSLARYGVSSGLLASVFPLCRPLSPFPMPPRYSHRLPRRVFRDCGCDAGVYFYPLSSFPAPPIVFQARPLLASKWEAPPSWDRDPLFSRVRVAPGNLGVSSGLSRPHVHAGKLRLAHREARQWSLTSDCNATSCPNAGVHEMCSDATLRGRVCTSDLAFRNCVR